MAPWYVWRNWRIVTTIADLSVATPLLIEELGKNGVRHGEAIVRVGAMTSLGVLAYALGKLFLGGLGDLWGGRINFLIGLAGFAGRPGICPGMLRVGLLGVGPLCVGLFCAGVRCVGVRCVGGRVGTGIRILSCHGSLGGIVRPDIAGIRLENNTTYYGLVASVAAA